MGLFGFDKKKNEPEKPSGPSVAELYGKAWLMIMNGDLDGGRDIFAQLNRSDYIEGTVALAMHIRDEGIRKGLFQKAAEAGNDVGKWVYCSMLPHSEKLDPKFPRDIYWEEQCLDAALSGSAAAMVAMGNIWGGRGHFPEAMYWYVMANAHILKPEADELKKIVECWKEVGSPGEFLPGSPAFDLPRHQIAIAYLEFYSQKATAITMAEIMKYASEGVTIAGYFAARYYESTGKDEEAYKVYDVLAKQNDAVAQRRCAMMMNVGRGTEKNPEGALDMMHKAAFNGDRLAMSALGDLFTRYNDSALAAYWYGRAFVRGDKAALEKMRELAKKDQQ